MGSFNVSGVPDTGGWAQPTSTVVRTINRRMVPSGASVKVRDNIDLDVHKKRVPILRAAALTWRLATGGTTDLLAGSALALGNLSRSSGGSENGHA